MSYSDIPEQLTHPSVKRWCVFRCYFYPDKIKKIPHHPLGHLASSNEPESWANFTDCMKAIEFGLGHYPGFALSLGYHLACVDIDRCINPVGEYSATAMKYLELFKGAAYIEKSLSGRGLHIYFWYTGKNTPPIHPEAGVELYTERQFVIITGDTIE